MNVKLFSSADETVLKKLLNMGTTLRNRATSRAWWFSWLRACSYLYCPVIFLWKFKKDGDTFFGNVLIFLTVRKMWIWVLSTWILPVWRPPRRETGRSDARNSRVKTFLWRSMICRWLSQQTDPAALLWNKSVFYCRLYFINCRGNCDRW